MKKIYLTIILLAATYANAQITESFPETKGDDLVSLPEDGALVDENAVYMASNVDVHPDYPGGIIKFRDYIKDNFKFENLNDGAPLEFKVFLNFIIEKDGKISGIRILKEPGYGAGKEVTRVLTLLKTKWSPGIKNGKPVRCSYTIPATLNGPDKNKTPANQSHVSEQIIEEGPTGDITIGTYQGDLDRGVEPVNENEVYSIAAVQVQPEFPGGIEALRKHLTAKINFDNFEGAEGTTLKVYVKFTVEKNGTMTDIMILKDPGYGVGKLVEQTLKGIKTRWAPGILNGKQVRSNYTLPIAIVVPSKKTVPAIIDEDPSASASTPKPDESIQPEDNSIYNSNTLQVQPDFPGGKQAFVNFINKNVSKETLKAVTTQKEITVFVQFIVEKDGTATNHKIVEAPNTGIMKEVLRVLSLAKQKWSPGNINGKPVRALYSTQVIIKVPQ